MRRSWLVGILLGGALAAALLFGPGVLSASGVEPAFCATCHVMNGPVTTYRDSYSLHSGEVTCSDCHLPRGVSGLTAKYTTGLRHLMVTLQGNSPSTPALTDDGRQLVLGNCVGCHADNSAMTEHGPDSCLDCHADDPHGKHGA
ncbi:MAG: NapC/NirT family cytochrome c [Mycobacterium leprae]